MVTSPHHPRIYPRNLLKTELLQVESGKIIKIKFTHFNIDVCGGIDVCSCDHVQIIDGDWSTLMGKSCGISTRDQTDPLFFQPPSITSRSRTVAVLFTTDAEYPRTGWSIAWAAVTPGHQFSNQQNVSQRCKCRVQPRLPWQPLQQPGRR